MATPPRALPTCTCGSPDFVEESVKMQVNVPEEEGVTSKELRSFWTRTCNRCGLVTFWSRPSGR